MAKVKKPPYTARSLSGAQQRVRELTAIVDDYERYAQLQRDDFKRLMAEVTNEQVDCRKIATAIADNLFVNGNGTHAERLMLVGADGRDLGGWCKQAVVDVIVDELKPAVRTPSK